MDTQRGFTIVELMVGLTIGLLLLTVLSALLVNNSQARVELDRTMQQVENGRYAMQLMSSELRLAGYYGEGATVGTVSAAAALPDPCATDLVSLKAALPVAIQGYSQVAASPLACLDGANVQTGSDVLVIRRAQTEPVALASLVPALPYIQTLGDDMVFDSGANSASFTLTKIGGALAPIHRYTTQIYFVSPCSVPASGTTCSAGADNGNPIPTLKRMELDSGGWSQPVSLVEGIERMRVEYGLDSDGDGAPDSYVLTPANAKQWSDVVSTNIGLLARNTRTTPGHVDSKTYRLVTLDIAAPQDGYKRHAYSGVVRFMNISGRREE
jgi:type IV pilus assembly protein PilW